MIQQRGEIDDTEGRESMASGREEGLESDPQMKTEEFISHTC